MVESLLQLRILLQLFIDFRIGLIKLIVIIDEETRIVKLVGFQMKLTYPK